MKVIAIKSARKGATGVHLGENTGWSSRPFCPALATGRREFPEGSGIVNCRNCIKIANDMLLDVEHLVFISDRVLELVAAVRAHAIMNYSVGAWDIIVEAFSNSELAETVRTCRTEAGAIRKVAKIVERYRARRAPHDAEIAAATENAADCGIDDHDHINAASASQCVILRGGKDKPEVVEYDRFAEGSHPDGSVVRWSHDPIGGESWATRTWPGKACSAAITVEQRMPDGDYVTFETYVPAWRGVTIDAPDVCDGVPF